MFIGYYWNGGGFWIREGSFLLVRYGGLFLCSALFVSDDWISGENIASIQDLRT